MKAVALLAAVISPDTKSVVQRQNSSIYRVNTVGLQQYLVDSFAAFGLNQGMSVYFESEGADLIVVIPQSAHDTASTRVDAWLAKATMVRPETIGGTTFEKRDDGMMHARINVDEMIEAMKSALSGESRMARDNIRVDGLPPHVWRSMVRKLGADAALIPGAGVSTPRHSSAQR